MPRIQAPFINTALEVARKATSTDGADMSALKPELRDAILAACQALDRHSDTTPGIREIVDLARRACGNRPVGSAKPADGGSAS